MKRLAASLQTGAALRNKANVREAQRMLTADRRKGYKPKHAQCPREQTKPIRPGGQMVGSAHPTKRLRTRHAKQSQFTLRMSRWAWVGLREHRGTVVQNKANWAGVGGNALRRHYERGLLCETKPIWSTLPGQLHALPGLWDFGLDAGSGVNRLDGADAG
jgi:hypothetical protein